MSNFSIAVLVSALVSLFTANTETHISDFPEPIKVRHIALTDAPVPEEIILDGDTNKVETPNDRRGDATTEGYLTPLYLRNPRNLIITYELAEDGEGYYVYEKMGGINVRPPSYISKEEYIRLRRQNDINDYFRETSLATNLENQRGLELNIDIDQLSDVFHGPISIRPTGYATLDFSLDHNRNDNPNLSQRQQRQTSFNFDQQIQLGVDGQIGDRMKLMNNFDTQATFDFENILKLEHEGTEDQILQSVKAGNLQMALGNSLIQGRQNLFGLKLGLRLGPVDLIGLASLERGKVDCITVSGGGAVETPFEKEVTDYDENRHFFLAHYFRSVYEESLKNLPIIQSRVRINRVEVWVEQQGATRYTRNAVGLIDLGENDMAFGTGQGVVFNDLLTTDPNKRYPDNEANNLYQMVRNDPQAREQSSAKGAIEALPFDMENTEDFQVLGNMRRLNRNEFTINSQLGFISLNTPVPTNQVLFVAFNGTINGQPFQVGEFSDDEPANGLNSNVLFLKMLKSSVLRTQASPEPYPAWDLMMKNIYNIGYGLDQDGFFLQVMYESGTSAGKVNFLPTGPVSNIPLIQVTGVDRLTNHTSAGADNIFDFVEGLTVIADRGMIIFPVLEPFGSHLAKRLDNDPEFVDRYVYQPLYDGTRQDAIQKYQELNRFTFEGYYRSAGGGAEIQLNTFQLSEESVVVKVGGRTLIKGTDYQIDASSGKVTFLNTAVLTTGQEIQVCFESSSLYQVQTKVLTGARAELNPSEYLSLGATIMNLKEQPFTQKTILGEEPTSNTLWGLDATYSRNSDWLTKQIDKLPLISTKETSSIDFAVETAQFRPGQPRAVRNREDRGIVYLDDFEAASTPFTLAGRLVWKLASFPEDEDDQINLYNPTKFYNHPRARNFSRARLSWYQIDQDFYQRFRNEVPERDLVGNYTRQVLPNEIFPTATRSFGNNIQYTFDMHYRPEQRGPYNYQADPNKIDAATGNMSNPEESWAGITREIDINNDFEASNIEFLEFWLMDPFMDQQLHDGGDFYINLGLVNEDLLNDETLAQEHGLPGDNDTLTVVDTTEYGLMAVGNPATPDFNTDPEDRTAQDVGMDGLSSLNEQLFFQGYLDSLQAFLSNDAFQAALADPSSDDYISSYDPGYNDSTAGIRTRYSKFNNLEGNSPVGETSNEDNRNQQATQRPDTEDLNENGSLNFAEQYWEYKISMRRQDLVPGQNYVVDKIDTIATPGGQQVPVTWYQFRIPLTSGRAVNGIENFKTITYMRMFMTGWNEEVIMRMTEFQLIASQWRRFTGELAEPGLILPSPEPPFPSFELGSVSKEENSKKLPFNYDLPPGIAQQAINGNTSNGFLQDERSLVLKACNLQDGDARGIFKVTKNDLRLYERIKMWVHAESVEDGIRPSNFYEKGDANLFIRFGLDQDLNYYEYEYPLTPSAPGIVNDIYNTWLEDNELDLELALFAAAKEARNTAGTGLIYRHEWRDTSMAEGHKIYVKGTPKLSDVRSIMIGVRNPSDPEAQPICIEVWVNELRMTNFDNTKGYAANVNANLRLGGIATLGVTGSYRSAGFGPLEQKLSERSQEDILRWDLNGTLQLEKFFPKKWGLQMPVYATWGEERINPQFNPQEADVRTDKLIETLDKEAAREKLQEIQDYKRSRSIAFNNWRKTPTRGQNGNNNGKKPTQRPSASPANPNRPGGLKQGGGNQGPISYPWDISNFDFSYAYSETFGRNAITARRFNTQHRARINYRYNFPQITVKPFKNVKKSRFLSSMQFNPLPNNATVSVTGNRLFEERLMRPTDLFGGATDPTYTKNFLINRNYNLSWNFSRTLQINFTADNTSRVDEVRGYWEQSTQIERDSVGPLRENLLHIGKDPSRGHDQLVNFGRTTNYTHSLNVAMQLPTSNIKFLNWINGTVNYTGSFNWQQAPEINPGLGATIGNSQNIQTNARIDLNNLYRKFKPLKAILDDQAKPVSTEKIEERKKSKAKGPRTLPLVSDPPFDPFKAGMEADSASKDPFRFLKLVAKEVARVALSIRSVDVTYNRTASTILPGYVPRTDNFGVDFGYTDTINGNLSPIVPPTWGFVFGSQEDLRPLASQYNWLTRDTLLSNLYMTSLQEQLTARTSVELFKGFRIDFSANRSIMDNQSEFFRWNPALNDFASFDPLANGNFSMSYIFVNTTFKQSTLENSPNFTSFSDIRQTVSRRYAEKHPDLGVLTQQGIVEGGYQNGYLGTNQDVLITSFLASYGLIDAEKVELTPFPQWPLPNWSINFNGLNTLPIIKEHFNSFTFRHAYRGTYSIGSYANNLNAVYFEGYPQAFTEVRLDANGQPLENFYAEENIQIAQINEQFSPFLGLNFALKNGVTGQIDYKRGRQLSLSVGSLQMTEMISQDLAFMAGYRKDQLNMYFRLGKRDIKLENSANFQLRATLRDTREATRYLSADPNEVTRAPLYTRGTFNLIVSPSIDYVVSNRLNIQVYYEHNINNPYVASTYRTSFASFGFQVRFTLSN